MRRTRGNIRTRLEKIEKSIRARVSRRAGSDCSRCRIGFTQVIFPAGGYGSCDEEGTFILESAADREKRLTREQPDNCPECGRKLNWSTRTIVPPLPDPLSELEENYYYG